MLQRSEQDLIRERDHLRDMVNDLKNQSEKDKDKVHDLEKLKVEQTADLAKRNDEINSLRGQLDDAHKKLQDKEMKLEQLEKLKATTAKKEGGRGSVTNEVTSGKEGVEENNEEGKSEGDDGHNWVAIDDRNTDDAAAQS